LSSPRCVPIPAVSYRRHKLGTGKALEEFFVPTVKATSQQICRVPELDFPIDEFNNTFLHLAVVQGDMTVKSTDISIDLTVTASVGFDTERCKHACF
jgi:hypothetical protein